MATRAGTGWRRALYGSGLVVLGACVGVLLGSWLDTPRLLLDRAVSRVDTVWLEPEPEPDPPAQPPPELARLAELSTGGARGSAAKPAPADGAKPAPADAAKPAPADGAKPAPEAAAKSASARPAAATPSADALIERLRRQTEAAPAAEPEPAAESPTPTPTRRAAPPVPAFSGPVVQIASYKLRADADALVQRMRAQGFRAFISGRQPEGTPRFRVRVAPAADQSPSALDAELRARGFDTWATRE